MNETVERFRCFGCDCAVYVIGDAPERSAAQAATWARDRLLELHERFSRFLPDSELSRFNRDPRERIPVTPLLAQLAQATRAAGAVSDGLIDATLLREVQDAGYTGDLRAAMPLPLALALAPARRPAGASPRADYARIAVDLTAPAVTRPPGVMLDSGGLAKGLFADTIADSLGGHASFAVDCGGDLALGGAALRERPIQVQSPFDRSVVHTVEVREGGVATSGIGRRSWLDERGRCAHHLLDPATGRPAFTGVVQTTAFAPSALLAEIHAKAALLSGPETAERWLPWGGVVVLDDASHRVVAPRSDTEPAQPMGAMRLCGA